MHRWLKWAGLSVLALIVVLAVSSALFDLNVRGAITRWVSGRTGRQLAIDGTLDWKVAWPHALIQARDVTFANPAWAQQKHLFSADGVDLSIDLPKLLTGKIVLANLQLERPVVMFEKGADGRANWRFGDDENEQSLWIGRVGMDQAQVTYRDPALKTDLVLEVTTHRDTSDAKAMTSSGSSDNVEFKASGQYLGMPFRASGRGGSVIALRDETNPYPLSVVATIGNTSVRADGTVTGLVTQSAANMKVSLRGESLADLFPVLGMALPDTRAYELAGQYGRNGESWRLEGFSGRIGASDVTGSLRKDVSGQRPMLHGDIAFKALHLGDLGPVIGEQVVANASPSRRTRRGKAAATRAAGRILPTVPFNRDRWNTVDADVRLKAQTIVRPKALPLENLNTRLRMHESVMTLEPLDFGAAGGHLDGIIRLDARHTPIEASARLNVRKLLLAKVLPTVTLAQGSSGHIDGHIELAGRGDTVGRMIASADGKVGLYVRDGKVSKILMQKMAMHMPEMLMQQLKGDEKVDIRCGVVAFDVQRGVMKVDTLVLDTDIARVTGTGNVDLASEKLNITLVPRAKRASLFAMRGPIRVRGDLADPDVEADTAQVGGRGLAALALSALNPLLSLVAVADPGEASEADCGTLVGKAQTTWSASPQGKRVASKR